MRSHRYRRRFYIKKMSVQDLLRLGGDDMIRELGIEVRLLRKGVVYSACWGVVSPTDVKFRVELGGAEREISAHAMIRLSDLEQIPKTGDRLTIKDVMGTHPAVYYVAGVTTGLNDPMVHLELAS